MQAFDDREQVFSSGDGAYSAELDWLDTYFEVNEEHLVDPMLARRFYSS